MAYETNLTTPVGMGALLRSALSPTIGYDAALFTDAVCTLGDKTGDLYVKVQFDTGVNATGTSLSAANGNVTLTLSSVSVIPVPKVIPAYISESTFNAAASAATITVKSNDVNFLNTSISLSANRTTTVIDPTKSSVIDNLIYINDAGTPVTTFGNSRLVSYLG